MKTFSATNNDGVDIFHIITNKDAYDITENNGTLTYTNKYNGNTYSITGNEIVSFKYNDAQGKRIFKWNDEWLPFSTIKATGGTVTTFGEYTVHVFNSSGTFEISSGKGVIEYMVVAGGGASGRSGNSSGGGGGGAGGYLAGTFSALDSKLTITVGDGGAADSNGQNSSLVGNNISVIAIGGGRGGIGSGAAGQPGGSGGGGNATNGSGGGGTPGQGFNGGNVGSLNQGDNGSAGGGGAGGAAPNNTWSNNGTAGGVGIVNGITGTDVEYAHGGVGGNGTYWAKVGAAGAANTGNGGSAGSYGKPSYPGGSGIVVLRYLT